MSSLRTRCCVQFPGVVNHFFFKINCEVLPMSYVLCNYADGVAWIILVIVLVSFAAWNFWIVFFEFDFGSRTFCSTETGMTHQRTSEKTSEDFKQLAPKLIWAKPDLSCVISNRRYDTVKIFQYPCNGNPNVAKYPPRSVEKLWCWLQPVVNIASNGFLRLSCQHASTSFVVWSLVNDGYGQSIGCL